MGLFFKLIFYQLEETEFFHFSFISKQFNPIALSVAIWQRLLVTVFRRKLKKIYTRQQIQLERLFHDIKTLILKKCEIMIKYCQKISLKNSRFFMPMVPPWKKNQIAYFRRKIQRGDPWKK